MSIKKKDPTLHARIQNRLLEVVNRLSIPAKTEVRGDGWRADVLADIGSRRVAFEVQTSTASHSDLRRRQTRYLRDRIDCCWLVLKVPLACRMEFPDLPVFRVIDVNGAYQVALIDDRRMASLDSFVADYLRGHIQFRRTMTVASTQNVRVVFFDMDCWKCSYNYHAYFVARPYVSSCHYEFDESEFSELWADRKLEFRPEIQSAVRQYLDSAGGTALRLGVIKQRSSRTIEEEYLSFGCPACDAILGDWYYFNAVLDARNHAASLPSFAATVITDSDAYLDLPHWCYPEATHCVQRSPNE